MKAKREAAEKAEIANSQPTDTTAPADLLGEHEDQDIIF